MLVPWIIRLGIARLAEGWSAPDFLSKDLRQEINYLSWQQNAIQAVESESFHATESAAQVRAAGNLGDRPLIVLTAAKSQLDDSLTEKDGLAQQDIWTVLQAEEAHLSSRGKQIVVPDSGHMIPFERPDAIISAIREVWSAAHISRR